MIGKTISHYKILEKLGGGGMGVVYKAEDTKLKRTVALKFLPQDVTRDQVVKQRFVREAQAASALDHPNIGTIYEIEDTDDGQMFIAMAYYEGETLKKKIEQGPLSLDETIDIAMQIAQGLAKAHKKEIVHRDIKPANILITEDAQVKIVDFGLAKLAGQTKITDPGTAIGTTAYMSPEQASGAVVDNRTDIWALGVVIYEMLTGELPFKGDYVQAVIFSILNEEPNRITESNSSIPLEFEKIVDRCLIKDSKERYQSADDLQTDLKGLKRNMGSRKTAFHITMAAVSRSFPESLRKIAVPLAGVILGLLLLLLLPYSREAVKKWLGLEAIPAEKHLAVLPLSNIGDDPSNQLFCDGLVETLTSKLTQLEQFHGSLWVLPASEVRKSGIISASEAWEAFRVPLVVTGSMQRMGERVRLTLNLVDTKTLRQLRSLVITDRITNVSTLQDGVAIELAQMLDFELKPETRRALTAGGTSLPGAYDFYLQGRGYLQHYENMENIDAAIGLFERALKEDPNYAMAYAGLGEAYWRKYKASKDVQWVKHAINHCDTALKLNDQIAAVHVTLGLIHRGTGRYEGALQEFKQARELDPVNAEAYREMARAYEALGKLDQAETTYQKAILLRPGYWANYNVLGVFYYRHGRYEDAVKQFQQVVALRPDNIKGYNNLGGLYFYLERWDEASQMFQHSLVIGPNYVAYSQLGTLYFYEARYADAAQMYKKALELLDEDYLVWGMLAACYYWSPDENDKAQAIYQRAAFLAEQRLEVNPHDPDVLSDLAAYYGRMGNRPKALSILKQVLTLEEYDLDVMFRIADIYEQLGERKSALRWIKMALEKGYSLVPVDHYPGLRELRADERFQRIREYSKK